MKNLLPIILALSVHSTWAEDLCLVNENVEPDMRMPESYFTKDRAAEASKKTQGIVTGTDKVYEWITVPNSLKLIEGYVLRRDALNSQGTMREYHVSQFCSFMQSEAWWYD
ncbi:hypothetical protein ACJJIL_12650 [Microbulbifer sp. EKSA005]|uniref:hypothetical protein n=1 Tax=Microbulbifer sp. EKSA005 TaxID=3243364 RepID=UPI004041079B